MKDWSWRRILFFLFALLLVFVLQKSYREEDTLVILPLAKHLVNPALYHPQDLLILASQNTPFLFYRCVGFFYHFWNDLSLFLYFFYAAMMFICSLSLVYFLRAFEEDLKVVLTTVALVMLSGHYNSTLLGSPFPVGEMTQSAFALPWCFFSLGFFFRGKFFPAALLAGVVFNFHPYVAAIAMSLMGFYLLFYAPMRSWKTFLISAIGFLICAAPTVFFILSRTSLVSPEIDNQFYYKLFRQTASHAFIHQDAAVLPAFFAFLFFIPFSFRYIERAQERDKKMLLIFIPAAALCILYSINAYFIGIRPFLAMFLFRVTYFTKPIFFYFCARAIQRSFQEHSLKTAAAAILILLACIVTPASSFIYLLAACIILFLNQKNLGWKSILIADAVMILMGLTAGRLRSDFYERSHFWYAVLFVHIFLLGIQIVRSSLRGGAADEAISFTNPFFILVFFLSFHLFAISKSFIPDGVRSLNYYLKEKYQTPGFQLSAWAKESTPPHALFLTPPDFLRLPMFALYAERSVFADRKQFVQAEFNPHYYFQYYERLNAMGWDMQSYQNKTQEEYLQLAKKYGIQYLIFDKTAPHSSLSLPKPYENENFVVYAVGQV